eukprot:TRINITY_DN20179_c0_g1_i1.p1 TRINITY_DN20179_c0_g1~~TRINITY_DN20179_c0_g1_i1.p1  ORF type:complete len:962 (+),score=351.95 TRINITY_DN20179_c0_g1_i1:92-2977(+)
MERRSPSPSLSAQSRDTRLSLPGHRAKEQSENEKRVQRQKLEKRFMSDISSQRHKGGLSELGVLKDQVNTAGRVTFDSKRPVLDHTRKAIEDRKEREARAHPKPAGYQPIRLTGQFHGAVRCIEPAQGGATLWTGDQDGTIAIRNGRTGDVVHHIPGSGGLFPDAIMATDNHMWVGCNDGTLRVYDSLVYIQVHEHRAHDGGITSLCPTFDEKVFSGGADGRVVKWDGERSSFAVLSQWSAQCDKVTALACYGYNLFVGAESGQIVCLDAESGQLLRRFEAHTGPVTALLVQDGFLFSGSGDCSVRAWDIENARCIMTLGVGAKPVGHAAAVTGVVGDAVAHHFWTSDAAGVVHVWESNPETDFKHLYTVSDHAESGRPIVHMRSLPCTDAVRMWSVSSCGENRCWYSAVNRAAEASRATVDAMESIIHQDLAELAKWKDLVRKLEGVDAERKRKLGALLAGGTGHFMLYHRYLQLFRFRAFQRRKRRYRMVAELAARSSASTWRFAMFQRWAAFLLKGKALRQKQAVANRLLSHTHSGLMHIYWHKIRAAAKLERRRLIRARASDCLLAGTDKGHMRIAWRKMRKYHDGAQRRRKRMATAEGLLRCSDRSLRRLYYFRLKAWVKWHKRMRGRLDLMDTLSRNTEAGFMRVYYLKLLHYRNIAGVRRQRLVRAECMAALCGKDLHTRYYGMLLHYRRAKGARRLQGEIGEEQKRKGLLKRDFDAKSAQLSRLKVIEARRSELQELRDRLEESRQAREDKKALLERVLQEAQEQRDSKERKQAEISSQLQVEDFMAKLKARVINYHRDYVLIEKTRDQVQPIGPLPVEKLFLESHMAVKRVVIEVTKHQIETGARWEQLRKGGKWRDIPDHHKMTILHAIKVMIICYDLMPQLIRDQLSTDDEILDNTEYLEFLADVGKREEDKRRGIYTSPPRRSSRSRKGSGASRRSQSAKRPGEPAAGP